MRTIVSERVLIGLIMAILMVASPALASDAPLFVLRVRGDKLTIDRMSIADGQTLTLDGGPASDVVDVIVPVGPGGSGNMADRRSGRSFTARFAGGALTVAERMPDGRGFERPARPIDELRACDTRISAVGADGHGENFIIRGYESVAADDAGPVVDMFAGKVPLSPHNYLICTDTWEISAGPPLAGQMDLEFDHYLFARGRAGDGREGDFVVDLGSGTTLVSKAYLPGGAKITPTATAQYSSAGKELLKYEPEGATGKVQSVLGQCELPALTLGGLSCGATSVEVMETLPKLAGREVAGIIGLDLLRRAAVVRLEFTDKHVRLTLERGQADGTSAAASPNRMPFSLVSSHALIRTGAGDHAIFWILDSGAPVTILDKQAADALRLAARSDATAAGGLDGGKIAFAPATLPELTFGGQRLTDLPISVASLPIFDRLHTHNQRVGLLGNDVLSRCGTIELDFRTRTLVAGKP